jgi:hypothetical protein
MRAAARTGLRVAAVGGLCVAAALSPWRNPTAVAAGGVSTISHGFPAGPVAYLESTDLTTALQAWRDSGMRKRWNGQAADDAMQHNRLVLRLGENLQALEDLAGQSVDLDGLIDLAGNEAGLALYDIADTQFVFEAQLGQPELSDTLLADATKSFDQRSYAGVSYFEGRGKNASLLFAMVGSRLVVANDLGHFHDALLLAALAEKVKTDGTAPPSSLADDPAYKGLAQALAVAPMVRVFVRMSALRGTHYFDDYWIFGKDSPRVAGIGAAMLALSEPDQGTIRETRVFQYDDDTDRPPAITETAVGGALDPVSSAGPIAKLGTLATVEPATGERVADLVSRLLPQSPADCPPGSTQPFCSPGNSAQLSTLTAAMGKALDAAGPTRLLDVVTVDVGDAGSGATARMPAVGRGGAVVVALGQGATFDRNAVESGIAAYVAAIATAGTPSTPAFADTAGHPGMRTIGLDLIPAALSMIGAGDHGDYVVFATSPDLAASLASQLSSGGDLAAVLADDGPILSHYDLKSASSGWQVLAEVLGARDDWADTDAQSLVTHIVPSVASAAGPGVSSVSTVGYRSGPYYVEDMAIQ